MPKTFALQAAEIAADASELAPANTPKYRRLTDIDRAYILRLSEKGRTQVQIAQQIGCSQTTVSEVLAAFDDTSTEAKRYLRGNALKAARNVVHRGKPSDHVAMLKGLGVLEDQQAQGFTVIVGGSSTVNIGLLSPVSPVIHLEPQGESLQIPQQKGTESNKQDYVNQLSASFESTKP